MARTSRAEPAATKRPLRSSAVVRELIVEAARACFAERGYAGTTTRQIARRAGVVENLIFKHFGNKAGLFDAAVVQPFRRAVDTFTERSQVDDGEPRSGESVARGYVEALYDLLEGHGELLLAVMADRSRAQPLVGLMEELERIGYSEMDAQGWPGANVKVLARLHFGMVAFNAAFGEALYPGGGGPSRDEVIDEMTAFLVHGSAHRTSSS
ncbi:MAG: TetR/AcrR family transcriptional regulator [Solirubrobacteraceae bacterium]